MMSFKNKPTLLACVLACLFSTSAMAQWQWIANDGSKVFSDQPPSNDVPEKNILKRPNGFPAPKPAAAASAASANGTDPATASTTGDAPQLSGVDKDLEEKKKQAEAQKAAAKQAEEAKLAKQKADNCERARTNKKTYDSGIRIAQVNDKGERIILDDAARATELKRIQGIIDSECK